MLNNMTLCAVSVYVVHLVLTTTSFKTSANHSLGSSTAIQNMQFDVFHHFHFQSSTALVTTDRSTYLKFSAIFLVPALKL